jgi:hypothetical protein
VDPLPLSPYAREAAKQKLFKVQYASLVNTADEVKGVGPSRGCRLMRADELEPKKEGHQLLLLFVPLERSHVQRRDRVLSCVLFESLRFNHAMRIDDVLGRFAGVEILTAASTTA